MPARPAACLCSPDHVHAVLAALLSAVMLAAVAALIVMPTATASTAPPRLFSAVRGPGESPSVPVAARAAATPPVVRATVNRAAPVRRTPKARPRARWMPHGTGMWIHDWAQTEGGNARRVVARARHAGLKTLYVRTGTRKGGFDGAPVLARLLPATRGTGISVVAWDFPFLRDPVADAKRLAAAARFRAGGVRVRAVAPDIETAAEGTLINSARVRVYLRQLRARLPKDVSILTTVPWPSEVRRGKYPYTAAAKGSDAIMPMAYWYNRHPAKVTRFSIQWLKRTYGKPVFPVGQGYDGRIDASWLPRYDIARQVGTFLVTARQQKVKAVSLWSWQTTGSAAWAKLARARHAYDAPKPKPKPKPRPKPKPVASRPEAPPPRPTDRS